MTAVLGTTGSGKSCSTALILRAILSEYPCGHVVMIDPHNEYWTAVGDPAEVIRPDTLDLPYWLLDFEETASVLVSKASDTAEAEATILKWAIVEAKKKFAGHDQPTDLYTVDTLVPYRIGDLVKLIDNSMGELDNAEGTIPYKRIIARIEALRADRRLDFMFGAPFVQDNMVEILARLFRIPTYGKPITILDISGLPAEIVDDYGVPTADYPFNPNGSVDGIAGICDESGRMLGMMPHAEGYLYYTNHPRWTRQRLPEEGMGVAIFRNAADYVRHSLE